VVKLAESIDTCRTVNVNAQEAVGLPDQLRDVFEQRSDIHRQVGNDGSKCCCCLGGSMEPSADISA